MKIVGITACTIGIAHTYMAREKLINAGEKLGIDINVETQGGSGVGTPLSDDDITNADAVLLAADVAVAGKERFAGKPIIEVPTNTAIKSPESLLTTIKNKLAK